MKKKKSWQDHGPPWRHHKDWEDWMHSPTRPGWPRHQMHRGRWHRSPNRLFVRLAAVFGLFVLLGCGVLMVLGASAMFLFPHRLPPEVNPGRYVILLLALAFVLFLALLLVGSIASRRFTNPLTETMKAADALAEGDLSARAPVEGSDEFQHFVRSFNRMAEALEVADLQRRELLADVAHELRTPLTIIQGNLEGLRDGVYEATTGHLNLVLDETHKLGRLVDDLRLLTLAEAGQLPLDLQPLNIPQLLSDVRDAFASQADEMGVTLNVAAPESLPVLLADPQRIGQVLNNLISNALRFTQPGDEIVLGAATVPDERAVQFWVSDTGAGIPVADLPRIFDRFWRGDPARSHQSGAGSGLGLAIAKGLVGAHGGRIWAESQVGQGTIIYCVLPITEPET